MSAAVLLFVVMLAAWWLIGVAVDYLGVIEVIAPNPAAPDHLREVIGEMRRRGPPRLRALRRGAGWATLEGSHRLAAAVLLGCRIELVEVADDTVDDWDLVWVESGERSPPQPAAQAAAAFAAAEATVHRFPARRVMVRRGRLLRGAWRIA